MAYIFKSILISVTLLVFYKLFLAKETFFQTNRIFFVLAVLLAFFLPLLYIPIYVEIEPLRFQPAFSTAVFDAVQEVQNSPVVFDTSIDWQSISLYTYMLGVLFFSVKFSIELISLTVLIRKNPKSKCQNVVLVEITDQNSPFSFFRWIVLKSSLFSEKEKQHIINHEMIHVKQWHSIDMLLAQILVIMQWFNPLAWMLKREMSQNLEYIADQSATKIKEQENIKAYQYLLLKTSIENNPFALPNYFFNSHLKKRIMMLQTNQTNSKNQWKNVLLIPIVAVFLYAFNTKEVYIVKNTENQRADTHNTIDQKTQDSLFFVSPIHPTNLTRIASGYGKRIHPILQEPKMHNGMDYVAYLGTDVLSAAKGTILEIGENTDDGKYISIAHAEGFQSNYKHLSVIQVEKGEAVVAGEIIGNLGNTGKSTGPHLHFELLKNKAFVNPIHFIPFQEVVANKSSDDDVFDGYNVGFDARVGVEELSQIAIDFKQKNKIDRFEISDIKRNEDGLITGIRIESDTHQSNQNFWVNGDNPISTIMMLYRKRDQLVKIISDDTKEPEQQEALTSTLHFFSGSKSKDKKLKVKRTPSDSRIYKFTAQSTDTALQEIEAYFAKTNLHVKFADVKRNTKGNIIAYALQTKTDEQESMMRYSVDKAEGVKAMTLQSVNNGNEILILPVNVDKDGVTELLIKQNSLVIEIDDEDEKTEQGTGVIRLKGKDYYYNIEKEGTIEFYDRFGTKIKSKNRIKKLRSKLNQEME